MRCSSTVDKRLMAGAGEFSKKIGSVEFSSSLGVLTSTGVFMNNGLYQICC